MQLNKKKAVKVAAILTGVGLIGGSLACAMDQNYTGDNGLTPGFEINKEMFVADNVGISDTNSSYVDDVFNKLCVGEASYFGYDVPFGIDGLEGKTPRIDYTEIDGRGYYAVIPESSKEPGKYKLKACWIDKKEPVISVAQKLAYPEHEFLIVLPEWTPAYEKVFGDKDDYLKEKIAEVYPGPFFLDSFEFNLNGSKFTAFQGIPLSKMDNLPKLDSKYVWPNVSEEWRTETFMSAFSPGPNDGDLWWDNNYDGIPQPEELATGMVPVKLGGKDFYAYVLSGMEKIKPLTVIINDIDSETSKKYVINFEDLDGNNLPNPRQMTSLIDDALELYGKNQAVWKMVDVDGDGRKDLILFIREGINPNPVLELMRELYE